MHAEINLKGSELNGEILKKLMGFLKGNQKANIKITISDENDYFEVLERSVSDARKKKDLITFTLEELMTYDTKAGK